MTIAVDLGRKATKPPTTYTHLHLRYGKYLKFSSPQNIILIYQKLKILKHINTEIDTSLVEVGEYIPFVKFIKVTYITVSNIIRSYVCPKCYQGSIRLGPEKLKY